MRNAVCYTLLSFALILPLAGQSGPGGDKPRQPARSAWFACISAIPDGVENPMKIMGGKDITEVELPNYMTSAPVKIPDDGVLSIVRSVPDPENPEEPKYVVQAQAKIPENVREALILLVPLPKPEGDRVFLTKIQDLASFKGGDRLFINLSSTQIRVNLGEAKVTVAPAQSNIYSVPALTKPTNTPIMYEFYHAGEQKWKLLSASTVVLRPTRREICVFNEGSRPGNIKKHGILFPVPQEQPGEAPPEEP